MRRLLLSLPILFMPLIAAGQSSTNDMHGAAKRSLKQQVDQVVQVDAGALPLWRGADGSMLTLKAENDTLAAIQRSDAPMVFRAADAAKTRSTDLEYGLSQGLRAHAGFSEHSWINNRVPRVIGSEVGATYSGSGYSIGLSVGANGTPNSATLPRLLPGMAPSVNGLSSFDSSTQLNARGRLALDSKSGIDVGASVGRIRLLSGNVLGLSTLDQKALSFGVDRGPLRGTIVGRSMQPDAGNPGASYSPDKRWRSIDLGVTWRLPWQGELSIGAQNVWSSGTGVNTPAGPEPDQSRTPYVQYHQDL
ncbi:hypothetical protein [Dyella tabacisoli]|uniref:TonB-dependent receptor n=1 Tax=Dyella tabacisoli TaxID=2282381 RepID=A0A369UJ43_9GAMM|nr:hypothetical protein [Dyella tabacisoli]RDD80556.1 hypothetical protein DVJ77_16905 [Dyella tabacisoli]